MGKKRQNTKHARAWVSEIIGWKPASTATRVFGLKGDPLNLSTDEMVTSNADDRTKWDVGKAGRIPGGKNNRLSKIGHGQVLFMGNDAAVGAVSFARVTQRATVSFAQLRRVEIDGDGTDDADAAVRALLVTLGLHAHQMAFGRGFALRSGAELRPNETNATWLSAGRDKQCEFGDEEATAALLHAALLHAKAAGVPLDGWGRAPTVLMPKENLSKAIRATWPELAD